MLKTINTKKSGFTLVEMLVAIAVFMIVMTVAVGSLISIIDANRKAQAIKNVVNNINFALESISKDMRVGTKYSCYNGSSWVVGNCMGDGGIGVKYLSGKLDGNNKNYTIRYKFVSSPSSGWGNIQMCMNTNYDDDNCLSWESLTAPVENVKITNMKFYVLGSGTASLPLASKKQPRVIITLEGVAGIKDSVKTSFNIQTTVSQRIREVQN